ncbi:MAG: hypothetical protein QM820_21095 [Minicystis sp.]
MSVIAARVWIVAADDALVTVPVGTVRDTVREISTRAIENADLASVFAERLAVTSEPVPDPRLASP